MLELADVHTYYGNIRALRGLSLSVERGEIVTLIGANGAGKTTTLRTISGLNQPREGQVLLNGERIDRVPAQRIARTHAPVRGRAASAPRRYRAARRP